MADGILWLMDLDRWDTDIMFARGIPPEELASRMGAAPGSALPPISEADVWEAAPGTSQPHDADGAGLIRVGRSGDWSFAVEYGDCGGSRRVDEVSRDGVEAVHLAPQPDHPPKVFTYGYGGKPLCSFGIGEESWRWGERPDLLVAELTAAGVLEPGGSESALRGAVPHQERDRRTLAVVETYFGLSLPWELVIVGRLPAYALRSEADHFGR